MKLRCMKCEKVKELSSEELQEVGEFVLGRKLKAVHFLKHLSMDMRNPCNDGREHEWEFEESFDKEVHQVSGHCNETEKIKVDKTNEISECSRIIKEYEDKRDAAMNVVGVCDNTIMSDKKKLKEIAYIDDPGLWSAE